MAGDTITDSGSRLRDNRHSIPYGFSLMSSIKSVAVLLGILMAGQVAAFEPFVKKTLDGACLAMSPPEFYETKIYIRKKDMQDCIASGGKEETKPSADEEEEEEVQVASS